MTTPADERARSIFLKYEKFPDPALPVIRILVSEGVDISTASSVCRTVARQWL
jgi:hypothetical protein